MTKDRECKAQMRKTEDNIENFQRRKEDAVRKRAKLMKMKRKRWREEKRMLSE